MKKGASSFFSGISDLIQSMQELSLAQIKDLARDAMEKLSLGQEKEASKILQRAPKALVNFSIQDIPYTTLILSQTADHPCSLAMFKYVLDHTTNVNLMPGGNGIIHTLAHSNYYMPLALLLNAEKEIPLDINMLSRDHKTAVYIASFYGSLECLDMLIRKKADIHIPDAHGLTPLHVAVAQGHIECAALLLKHGAKIDSTNQEGQTPLHFLPMSESEQMLHLALEHGGDLRKKDRHGDTPCQFAPKIGYDDFSQVMKRNVPSLLTLCVNFICRAKQSNTSFTQSFPQLYSNRNINTALPTDLIERTEKTWRCK